MATKTTCTKLPEHQASAWFGLMHVHAELTRALDADLLAAHGLSLSAHEVLLRLEECDDARMRMSELAGLVAVTPSRVTRVVDALVRDGFVQRVSCEEDARVTYAEITDSGRKLLAAAQETHLAVVRERFLEHFSDDELHRLAEYWHRLAA